MDHRSNIFLKIYSRRTKERIGWATEWKKEYLSLKQERKEMQATTLKPRFYSNTKHILRFLLPKHILHIFRCSLSKTTSWQFFPNKTYLQRDGKYKRHDFFFPPKINGNKKKKVDNICKPPHRPNKKMIGRIFCNHSEALERTWALSSSGKIAIHTFQFSFKIGLKVKTMKKAEVKI